MPGRITFVGHATLLIELDGARFLTDPVLRSRLGHLRRYAAPVADEVTRDVDAVLISHLHHDHFDAASLRRLPAGTPVVVPRGGGDLVRRTGFPDVREVEEGDVLQIAGAEVRVVRAEHDDRRGPGPRGARASPVGYVAEGGASVYFAGDTDVFDDMRLLGPLDVALLPIWGWGPKLGPGHMDPRVAAQSLTLLRARIAVPIHWGTLYPFPIRRWQPGPSNDPPHQFARHAGELAPGVEVRILQPGESLDLQ